MTLKLALPKLGVLVVNVSFGRAVFIVGRFQPGNLVVILVALLVNLDLPIFVLNQPGADDLLLGKLLGNGLGHQQAPQAGGQHPPAWEVNQFLHLLRLHLLRHNCKGLEVKKIK